MVTCANLASTRDGRKVVVLGIVLVRQKPGSAKGVMFITVEGETGVANLVLWADRFEEQRRPVLSAGMIAGHGRLQRQGEVVHVVTGYLEDLSHLLRSVGERDEPFPTQHGRGDGATHPAGRDPRSGPGAVLDGAPARDIHIPGLRLGSGIKVPARISGRSLSAVRRFVVVPEPHGRAKGRTFRKVWHLRVPLREGPLATHVELCDGLPSRRSPGGRSRSPLA